MRYKEFITEAGVIPYEHENLELNKAMKLLNAHCTEALPMLETPIWRSMKNHNESIVYIDTTNSMRKSQNTSNHYTLLMDNSPYYKGWPKRSNSLIASTSKGYATAFYGTLYALFPFNGTNIAVCPNRDIWETRVDLSAFEGFESTTFETIADFCQNNLSLPDSSYDALVAKLYTPRLENEINHYASFPRIVTAHNFIDYMNKQMSPAAVGMKLQSISEFAVGPYTSLSREVWFSGKCIAIEHSLWHQFVSAKNGTAEPEPETPLPWEV